MVVRGTNVLSIAYTIRDSIATLIGLTAEQVVTGARWVLERGKDALDTVSKGKDIVASLLGRAAEKVVTSVGWLGPGLGRVFTSAVVYF